MEVALDVVPCIPPVSADQTARRCNRVAIHPRLDAGRRSPGPPSEAGSPGFRGGCVGWLAVLAGRYEVGTGSTRGRQLALLTPVPQAGRGLGAFLRYALRKRQYVLSHFFCENCPQKEGDNFA